MEKIMKVDSKPIYLGYERERRKYYFYVIKQGVPRFLSYIQYFFWDKGPESVLQLKAIPPEVEQELINYLEGSLGYEFFKQRRNSKEQSVRKVYRLPELDVSEQPIELTRGLADGGSGRTNPRRSSGQHSAPGLPHEPDADASKRRTRRLRHADSEACSSVSNEPLATSVVKKAEPVPTVQTKEKTKPETQEVKQKKPKRIVAEIILEPTISEIPEPAKQNSKMLKALEKLSKSSPATEVEVPKKLKKVIEPKPLVPTEAVAVSRGRSKQNASTLDKPEEVTQKVKASDNGKSIRPDVNVTVPKKSKTPKPK